MLNEAPIGSDGLAHVSRWMTAPDFLQFMQHFAKHAKPNPSLPILVLLNNHESHILVDILNYCKEVGIVLRTFPPHCGKQTATFRFVGIWTAKPYCCNRLGRQQP
ncbi:hypothetical protein ILUMI_15089 [Ignelater luminosus]|uniref:DDE-1 domain-containing protein n=1 Tax=Ignelater luminosus TaxID=2038154 RepID=A0A8K0CP98_IGNLU|nr:hypothetical protein ILUMI_15089 [Ignelater luminosus]